MLGHYLTVALRNFRRAPVATLIELLVLSLGLVCFLVAFSVVDYWGHAERGFAKASRTYVITAEYWLSTSRDSGPMSARFQPSDIDALRLDFPEFETVARASEAGESSVVAGAKKMRLYAAYADPSFLAVFDLPFQAGNAKTALSRPRSAVLTNAAALRLFGTTKVLGRTFRYDGIVDLTVTGVIGAIPQPSHIGRTASSLLRFDILASWDVRDGVAAALSAAQNFGSAGNCLAYVVLPKGSNATPQSLASRLAAVAESHVPASQRDLVRWAYAMMPISELMASQLDTALFSGTTVGLSVSTLLMIFGALVLAVACINYANLATAGALRRAKDVGLRKVIGARERQIVGQYLLEAGLLAGAAFGLAVLVIALLAPVIRAATDIDVTFVLFSGGLDFWLFTTIAVVAAALLAGAYPAFVLSRVRPIRALKVGGAKSGHRSIPALLVGIQFAAASFLLIAVIVMQQETVYLYRTGLSTDREPVIVINNTSAFSGVDSGSLEAALRGLSQVRAVSGTTKPIWSGAIGNNSFVQTPDDSSSLRTAVNNNVDYGFFKAMRIHALAGRVFSRTRPDTDPTDFNTPVNVVIDEAFSRELGFTVPQDAVGQLVYLPVGERLKPTRIIGVVQNKPLYFASKGVHANVYYLATHPSRIIVRLAGGDIPGALRAIEGVWNKLAPGRVFHYEFEDQLFAQGYALFGHVSQGFAALALLALSICVVGLIGMAGHMTARRRREIGVRKTFGATTGRVLRLLLFGFSKPVVIANLAAWPLAYLAATTYLDIFIHRIELTPLPFVLSLAVALLVAWASVGVQAWRAARMAPVRVLRNE